MLKRNLIPAVLLGFLCLFITISCDEDPVIIEDMDMPVPIGEILRDAVVTLNPSGYNPLAAYIDLDMFSGTEVTDVDIRVIGQNGADSDVIESAAITDTMPQLTVLGLYGDYDNQVELTFRKGNGFALSDTIITITTAALSGDLPVITINTAASTDWGDDMHLVSYWGADGTLPGDFFAQTPFMMDKYGDIRWYLDYTSHPELFGMNYVNGMEVLANGNLYFGTASIALFGSTNSPDGIYEVDRLGNVVNSWEMPGYQPHHEVLEKPNGNFLATVTKFSEPTIEDFLIEIDRTSGTIVQEWDLRNSMDYDRQTYTDDEVDWIHVNALAYDETDNTIIVSGRTQGVFKIGYDDKVDWILSTHRDWGLSGDGDSLTNVLLTPLDDNDMPITDTSLLKGYAKTDYWDWTWGQHAPKILPSGNILIFDNGDDRIFNGNEPDFAYSRAVEYEIDEVNMTAKQVWDFGESYGNAGFSRIVSEADYLEEYNSVSITTGSVQDGTDYGKVIEVDRSTDQVLFEATITPPAAFFSILTMHRSERMPLYP